MSHWSLTQLYLVTGRNISMRSGTLRMILKAQRAAFFRMYALEDLSSFSTSGAKSRAISTDAIEPSVQSAKPTTNCANWSGAKLPSPLSAGLPRNTNCEEGEGMGDCSTTHLRCRGDARGCTADRKQRDPCSTLKPLIHTHYNIPLCVVTWQILCETCGMRATHRSQKRWVKRGSIGAGHSPDSRWRCRRCGQSP